MKFKSFTAFLFTCLAISLLAGCGGDGFHGSAISGNGGNTGGTGSSPKPTSQPQTSLAANLQLSASTTSIGTGNNTGITLTAKVLDSGNRLLSGENVDFSSDGGALQVTSGTTSDAGAAFATLTTTGDSANRTIKVTATVPGTSASDTVDIDVSGSVITISGSDTLTVGDTTNLTIFLKDSTNTGIANQSYNISSSDDSIASLSSSTTETNNSGQDSVTVTGVSKGTATITVSTLGLTQNYVINVTNDAFALSGLTARQEVNINTPQTVTLVWTSNGTAQSGNLIEFSNTKGTLSASTATTDASGSASTTISSATIGPATLTAKDAASGLTTSVDFEFVVPPSDVDSIDLQANKTTIGPNGEQSVLTATARDINNNLVKNVDVLFSITQDNSAGSISNGSDLTNSLGRASTVYTSSDATTSKDGVHIHAQVRGADCTVTPQLCNDKQITVAKSQLFVVLGTSNLIVPKGDTLYTKEWNVLVTDATGNPVANTPVKLSVVPTYYYIGQYFWNDTDKQWDQFFGDGTGTQNLYDYKCINEDFSRDGVLDSGEDLNNNQQLDPRNVATVIDTVTTDADGYATFKVTWAKQYATWVDVLLTATASVTGTESSASTTFTLPLVVGDIKNKDTTPVEFSPWFAQVMDNNNLLTSTCFKDVSYVPQNVVALPTSTAGQINVQWDSLVGASSYNLYTSTTSGTGSAGTKITGVTSPYAVTGLTSGVPTYIVVTAVVNGQETAISNEATAIAP